MKLAGAVVLVTGANRGIGRAFAQAALARGARKVYAAARNPGALKIEGVEPVQLDVTVASEVAAAARSCPDATLVINNAGIARPGGLLTHEDPVADLQAHLETNVFGILRMSRAFAPILKANGGGAFLNVLSVASWFNSGWATSYGVSKAAAWNLTNGLRTELRPQNTQVLALHMGFVDTDMTKGVDMPKATPQFIVDQAYDALEANLSEVLADDRSRQIKAGLTSDPPFYL